MEPASLSEASEKSTPQGKIKHFVTLERSFTSGDQDPFETVDWSRRDAQAGDFFQADVEAPSNWSDLSVGITAKLYFATIDDVRETSVRQLIHRVAHRLALEGIKGGYFPGIHDGADPGTPGTHGHPATAFYDELVYICLHQYAAFNTPVWLNIGVPGRKQVTSACFLLSVADKMMGDGGITDWWSKEASIFKGGAGSGTSVSNIRGSMEPLSTGGIASGPLAYMRTADSGAGTLKSGGAHRRAAKMVQLDVDHPDIVDFIDAKPREDDRMRALIDAGFNLDPFTAEGERNIAETTSFQNGNISVRVSHEFMRRATRDAARPHTWPLFARTTGKVTETVDPVELLRKAATAAWQCADPGIMFDDTINEWHTTPKNGPITTSNPCGEVHINDNSACNLASLNLLKFLPEDPGEDFYVEDFRHVVDVMTTAMDITCGFSHLPTEEIERNTRNMRQLGLGYTNLGAAMMVQGMPYDSDEGRRWAADVTALLTGRCYHRSAQMARDLEPFAYYEENSEAMGGVIDKHIASLPPSGTEIWGAAREDWNDARLLGQEHGYRNSQATVIAPTGTTSYMMGADTTGCEPAYDLVTYKSLAAGGSVKIVNGSVLRAASNLGGYSEENLRRMADGDFSCISDEDRSIFYGANEIPWQGHVKMLASIQPFLSGAASKTVNLHNDATVDDIVDIYVEAWRLGVKCIAVYRDGSKVTQVLKSAPKESQVVQDKIDQQVLPRNRMPRTRQSITHKIHVRSESGDHEGYVIAGMYPDGRLGEIFLEGFGKLGGFTQNALSAWATDASMGMQYGMPMDVWCLKHAYMGDETGGTVVPEPGEPVWLMSCTSIVDYIARWIAGQFGDVDLCDELGVMTDAVKARKSAALDNGQTVTVEIHAEDHAASSELATAALEVSNGHGKTPILGPQCSQCSKRMHRIGSCWRCVCGLTTGCS